MLRLSNGDGMISARARASSASRTRFVDEAERPDQRMLGNRHRRRPGHHELHVAARPRRSAGSAGSAPRSPCSDRSRPRYSTNGSARPQRVEARADPRRPTPGSSPDPMTADGVPPARAPPPASPLPASGTGSPSAARRTARARRRGSADPLRRSAPARRDRRPAAGRSRRRRSGTTRTARDRTRRRARRRCVEQLRRIGAVLAEPLLLLRRRSRDRRRSRSLRSMKRCMSRSRATGNRSTRSGPIARLAGGIVIAPGDVILGAGREDGDVVLRGEMLGDEAAVPLGAAGDVGPEPVDDARQLHRAGLPAEADAPVSMSSAKAGVLERELLDAGEQHPVEMILAAEVVLAVLEQPARQRQQHASSWRTG